VWQEFGRKIQGPGSTLVQQYTDKLVNGSGTTLLRQYMMQAHQGAVSLGHVLVPQVASIIIPLQVVLPDSRVLPSMEL
jgi:hypothetical protein